MEDASSPTLLYQFFGALAIFLLGGAVTFVVSLLRRTKAAEKRATVAETVAREAVKEQEENRVENLSDDEADREAHDLSVLSDRRILRRNEDGSGS